MYSQRTAKNLGGSVALKETSMFLFSSGVQGNTGAPAMAYRESEESIVPMKLG
jgi:hypothetical protein